jgi:nucleotide-binding universal stress UspA family protein
LDSYRLVNIPELRPIAVAVTELPDPAALAALEADDRKQLILRLSSTTRDWAQAVKPLLARPGIRPQAQVLQGQPAAAIIEEARRSGARLVVLSSRGARSPSGPPLGSVTLQVAGFSEDRFNDSMSNNPDVFRRAMR